MKFDTTDKECLLAELRAAGAEIRGDGREIKCPFHQDDHASGGIYQAEDGVWRYKCHAGSCLFCGDAFDVLSRAENKPLPEVLKEHKPDDRGIASLRARRDEPKVYESIDAINGLVPGTIDATYTYTNPTTRKPDLVVIRYRKNDKKAFWQVSPHGEGWVLKRPSGLLPLYNRIQVAESGTVLVVEGEKCVHTLRNCGFVGTTSPMGAGKASYADWGPLAGKVAILWPDNDDAGIKHMQEVAEILDHLTPPAKVYWVDPAGLNLPVKGDVADFVSGRDQHAACDAVVTVMDAATPMGASGELAELLEDTIAGRRVAVSWPWAGLSNMSRALLPGTITLLCGAPGGSKCLSPETRLLMADGSIRTAGDVGVGDMLMGDDSLPRRILGVRRGKEQMYEVRPVKGEPFRVSENHILHFTRIHRDKVKGRYWYKGCDTYNMSVREYLDKPKTFKEKAKLRRTGVAFPPQPVPIDPYFVGVWLGDGTRYWPEITTADIEIEEACREVAAQWGLRVVCHRKPGDKAQAVRLSGKKGDNPLMAVMNNLDLIHNKHIPPIYLYNSEEVRLALLAGLLDTDGCTSHNCCYITQKNNRLADDIVYLARSLGFAAYVRKLTSTIASTGFQGEYNAIVISGHTSRIPVRLKRRKAAVRLQKKDVLKTGFTVVPVGLGNYVSIEIDGNHLHLLADFTVVHNSFITLQALRHWYSEKVNAAVFELEEDRAYHLNRILAQECENGGLLDPEWIRSHPEEVRQIMKTHRSFLDSMGRMIYAAPKDQVSYDMLVEWTEARAKEGARVIVIDPITAVAPAKDVWVADSDFIFKAKGIAREYKCSILLVTHPRKGKGNTCSMDDLAGGAAFQRFSQTLLWLESFKSPKSVSVRSACGTFTTKCNRMIHLFKCRNGKGTGLSLGEVWDGEKLALAEQGVVVKEHREKENDDNLP